MQPQHNNYATETAMHAGQQQRERDRGNSLDWLQVSDLGPSKIVLPGESVNKKLLRVLQPKQQQQQQQRKKNTTRKYVQKNNNNNSNKTSKATTSNRKVKCN